MGTRERDSLRPAEADLEHARYSLAGKHYDWTCFAAQQAADKAAKAAHKAKGQEAWGHSVTVLLQALADFDSTIDAALLDRRRALDKLYIPTRYPNGLPSGAPADFFTRAEAERAIADAEAIVAVCRRIVSG